MREPNAIDFWRGLALITIFVNHMPGNLFEPFMYSRYTISDATELFVFLAGWSLALATKRGGVADPPGAVIMRVATRTVEVYRAQLVITAIAFAMIAAAALYFDNPLLLEWHGAGAFFGAPIPSIIGWVALTYQLGYFNILPLYVVLLMLAPIFILIARASRWAALAASFALYMACLVYEIAMPSWPAEGSWNYNPLAWQFLLVLGFVASEWSRESAAFRRWAWRLMPLGIVGVVLGLVAYFLEWKPDPLAVPDPRLVFIMDKPFFSPLRLLHFLALALAFQRLFRFIGPTIPWLTRQLSALGRNSLAVFSVGSLASLAGQLVRFFTGGGFIVDALVLSIGLGIMSFTAWFVEWRSRSRSPSSLSS
ncbi:MAG: OpgC family protein [Microvirga sp.]